MMLLRAPALSHVLLIRPGATEFDEQGRIKGSLDMPLSDAGRRQAATLAAELEGLPVKHIYAGPCESARQTAECIAEGRETRIRIVESLRNVDHGLWHGKLIDEVKRNHPRVYRQGIEAPIQVCPPGGESIQSAQARVEKFVRKTIRKHRDEVIAIVVPDPLASLVQSLLSGEQMEGTLWKSETDAGHWQMIDVGSR